MRRLLVAAILISWLFAGSSGEKVWSSDELTPAALAEGQNGVVVGVSGELAVNAGLEILKKGGGAADAALATALAQVVECGGSYVSFAGVVSMGYYDADSGKVHYLNAGFNAPLDEKEPLTIPGDGQSIGRTVLVPGFMAGVQAAHDRFGKLPRRQVFAPAIDMAEKGVRVNALLGAQLKGMEDVLKRREEGRRIFTREGGAFFAEGDQFRQRELAETLRQVAENGSAFMYEGPWAAKFVSAVQREGGRLTLDDLKSYRATWDEPVKTDHRGYQVYAPGLSSQSGPALIEALHLLEQADLPKLGHFLTTPKALFWLMQLSHCQELSFLPGKTLQNFERLDLTPASRVKRETAAAIWQRMQEGTWPLAAKLGGTERAARNHSDAVVVVDRWGNMAALTHSIYSYPWGRCGLFVDGVSISDAGSLLQTFMQQSGPGKRIPDAMCPVIVLLEDKAFLGASTIGKSLYPRNLQVFDERA
jgi:gamma-glutamyltranspeptidase/glutathione hydrolase